VVVEGSGRCQTSQLFGWAQYNPSRKALGSCKMLCDKAGHRRETFSECFVAHRVVSAACRMDTARWRKSWRETHGQPYKVMIFNTFGSRAMLVGWLFCQACTE
jgi:hypothetical protein